MAEMSCDLAPDQQKLLLLSMGQQQQYIAIDGIAIMNGTNDNNGTGNVLDLNVDGKEEKEEEGTKVDQAQQQQQFNASEHFFEGAEKLLEIWFTAGAAAVDNNNASDGNAVAAAPMKNDGTETAKAHSLRAIPKRELDRLLERAGCQILQTLRTEQIDSYLLSESSLFVSDRRIILKTCGQTRPLLVIGELLELARTHAHMEGVSNVYYSRKNFFRPHLQPQLHATFDEECNHLDGFFQGGTAYCMGPLKQDRWYLYTLMPTTPRAAPLNCSDHTLELQMSGIPSELLHVYSWAECPNGAAECTARSGILALLPEGTLVQDELFKPVGYSMNGVLAGHGGEYVTIHVTPEPEFCYVSFETNHRRGCLYEQSVRVLELYRPARFILTLFANEHSVGAQQAQHRLWRADIAGYTRSTVQMLRLQYDTVLFALYIRDEGTMPVTQTKMPAAMNCCVTNKFAAASDHCNGIAAAVDGHDCGYSHQNGTAPGGGCALGHGNVCR